MDLLKWVRKGDRKLNKTQPGFLQLLL